jgi:dihydrofolate reductase
MTTPARAHVFIATSADGFIARPDGSIDWLLKLHSASPPGEDFGYAAFVADKQALIMGSASFETALGFPEWPYATLPVWVASRRGVVVPPALRASVTVSADAPAALLQRLGEAGVREAYLDGGQLIQAYLREGLVASLTVTTVPVLIGQGRALWGPLPADLPLQLTTSRHWPNGFVQNTWVPVSP